MNQNNTFTKPAHVTIALGSNLGDKLANLCAARDALKMLASSEHPFLQAPLYLSSPQACPDDSPEFYNTVASFHYAGNPSQLLEATRGIETKLGRKKSFVKNAPRSIDLDILLFDQLISCDENLTLPHPRITERAFVMRPLLHLQPTLTLPGDSQPLIHYSIDDAELQLVEENW